MTLTLLGFIFSFVACSDDDDKKATYGDLPTKAQTFLETHFGGNSGILNITKDNDSYDVIYDKFKIEFDLDGEWDSIDGTINRQSNAIPSTVIALIPSTIAEYVAVNYGEAKIIEVDREPWGYEIDLDNNIDLKFDLDGKFIGKDK